MSEAPKYHLANRLAGHSNEVRGVANFSKMPNSFVSCSMDKAVIHWVPKEGGEYEMKPLQKVHQNYVVEVCDFKDHVASIGFDKFVCIFDPLTGKLVKSKPVQTQNGSALYISERHILTGGWDFIANVYTHDLEHKLELKGHQASVLAVLELEDGIIVTGCADGTIKLWDQTGDCVKTFKAHKLAVRSLLEVKGVGFYSASNDGRVILWTSRGKKVDHFDAHRHFVFQLRRLGEKQLMTCSEDQTVKIWEDKKLVQSLEHPSCIWDCCALPNGDIVAACGNGNVYVWTTDENKQIDPVILESMKKDIYESKSKRSGVNVKELEGPWALETPGTRQGQVKMINMDGKGKVFQWNMKEKRWLMLGDLVDGPGSEQFSGKKELDGKFYDFVFNVELGEGGEMKKIGYNLGEDPYEVAKKWCYKHGVSVQFLETVAKFVIKNSGQIYYGDREKVEDPYEKRSKEKLKRMNEEKRERERKHFPSDKRVSVSVKKWGLLWKKVRGLNDTVDSGVKLTNEEFDLMSHHFEKNPNDPVGDNVMKCFISKFLEWPLDKVFPAVDIFATLIIRPNIRDYFKKQDTPNLVPTFLKIFRKCFPGKEPEKQNIALHITGLKLMCNMLSVEENDAFMRLSHVVLTRPTKIVMATAEKDPVRLTGSKCLGNMAIVMINNEEMVFDVLDIICEMLKVEIQRKESKVKDILLYSLLQSLGTLVYLSLENNVPKVKKRCKELKVLQLISPISSESPKIKGIRDQLFTFLTKK